MTNRQIAEKVINKILKNLADSTFRDQFPAAHAELYEYKEDMIKDIQEELTLVKN